MAAGRRAGYRRAARQPPAALALRAGRPPAALARLFVAEQRAAPQSLAAGAARCRRRRRHWLAIPHPVRPGFRRRPALPVHGLKTDGNAHATRRHGRRHARFLPAAHPLFLLAKHSDRLMAARRHDGARCHADPHPRRRAAAWRHRALCRAAAHAGHPLHDHRLPALPAHCRAVVGLTARRLFGPHRAFRPDVARLDEQPDPVRRHRLPRSVQRQNTGQAATLLARTGTRRLRRQDLAPPRAQHRPAGPAAGH